MIDTSKLILLIDEPDFISWLNDNIEIDDIDDIRKRNPGMPLEVALIHLYNDICKDKALKRKFIELIVDKFSWIIKCDDINIAEMIFNGEDPNGVFTAYDFGMLRFPMQLIITSDDSIKLTCAINNFNERHKEVRSIVIGKYGYIEYIPHNIDIGPPDEYWEINKYRSKI